MITNRRTFIVKRGRLQEAAALIKAEAERVDIANPQRVYVPEIAPFDVLVYEADYESLAEYEQVWAEWLASPEAAAFLEQWDAITETGGTNEIWTLVE